MEVDHFAGDFPMEIHNKKGLAVCVFSPFKKIETA